MTLNQLTDKVMPIIVVAMVLTCGTAVVKLEVLSEKVVHLEKAMTAYHEMD